VKVTALRKLRAADLPPIEGELGPGLVALVGTPEDAAEVRRALIWAVATEEGTVEVDAGGHGASVERLWGGTGGLREAIEAAVGWVAGPALARVEAARAALERGRPRVALPEASGDQVEEALLRLAGAPEELRAEERAVRELRGEWAEVSGDVEQATMEWLRERQDAETTLQAYRDRARELKARLAQIEASGPEAPCPTCGRPLADHLSDVRIQLREEWESVVQDGSWWKRRREQLEDKPEHLRALEGRALRLHATMETAAERLEVARTRVREREVLRAGAAAEPGSPEARALDRLAGELRAAALAAVLRDAGRIAERLTGGRVLWIRDGEDGPVAEGIFHGGAPAARDRAAVELACRVAAARLARAAGAPLRGMVVGEALDALDPEDRLRSGEVMGELTLALGQVVVITGTDLVELRPELFARALLLRGDAREGGQLARLAVGSATLSLSA
jgi:hypothetical protein